MRTVVLSRIAEVAASAWDSLDHNGNPFLCHAFFATLEETACVGPSTGWMPHYITLWDDHGLAAAVPAYIKTHSYGEFVFDWAWAQAYARYGARYYPKLVCAVPFSPVTGPRLLLRADSPMSTKEQLYRAVAAEAESLAVSSVHWLFPNEPDGELLQRQHVIMRDAYQFHWHNPGYREFDDYLGALLAKKRKNIRRERHAVTAAGVHVALRPASDVTTLEWDRFYRLYRNTTEAKGGTAYLTHDFFPTLAQRMPDSVLLVTAYRDSTMIAGAFCLRGKDTLYGRNWGCSEFVDGLHFETCYYTPIQYCIEHGLRVFEAGAQGVHKLARGFLPQRTLSAHWIADEAFRMAIQRHVAEERAYIQHDLDELSDHAPFRDAATIDTLPMPCSLQQNKPS